jgi:hypothetical protein
MEIWYTDRLGRSTECLACGETLLISDDKAEVVSKDGGDRGLVHQDCYLQHSDWYDLA